MRQSDFISLLGDVALESLEEALVIKGLSIGSADWLDDFRAGSVAFFFLFLVHFTTRSVMSQNHFVPVLGHHALEHLEQAFVAKGLSVGRADGLQHLRARLDASFFSLVREDAPLTTSLMDERDFFAVAGLLALVDFVQAFVIVGGSVGSADRGVNSVADS